MSRLSGCAFQSFVLMTDVFVVIIPRLRSWLGEVIVLMGPSDEYFVRDYKSIDEEHKGKRMNCLHEDIETIRQCLSSAT